MTKPPSNLTHLNRLFDNWSRDAEAPIAARRLRQLVCSTVLAQMLDDLQHEPEAAQFAFKGGAASQFRFGAGARATSDVDALTNASLGEAFDVLAARMGAGWSGFTGHLMARSEITRAGIIPAPQRCKIKFQYLTRPFATIDFELGVNADLVALSEVVDNAIALDRAQLETNASILLLNVHHQIAQKLHACTEVHIAGNNDRVHDVYDILLLADLAEDDGLNRTRDACVSTFSERQKHEWPPSLPNWDAWPMLWAAMDVSNELRYPYELARERLIGFIERVQTT